MNNLGIQPKDQLKQIIEHYIPLGNDKSLCHVGICSIKRCSRCQDAIKIRQLIIDLLGV